MKKIAYIIIALSLLINISIISRPLNTIDGYTISDDSYLSLTISKNIANGLGPLYGDSYTNGFQPLFVFITVPLFWLFKDNLILPIQGALIILALFSTFSQFFL